MFDALQDNDNNDETEWKFVKSKKMPNKKDEDEKKEEKRKDEKKEEKFNQNNDFYDEKIKKYDECKRKTILCEHMMLSGYCSYGEGCMFAHSLEEQSVEDIRKKAYGIIMENKNLNDIDLQTNGELCKILLLFTSVCPNCMLGKCRGGYNCKNGVCNIKYKICKEDLIYGECHNPRCSCIHLSNRGLKPIFKKPTKCSIEKNRSMQIKMESNDKIIKSVTETRITNVVNQPLVCNKDILEEHKNDRNIEEEKSDEKIISDVEENDEGNIEENDEDNDEENDEGNVEENDEGNEEDIDLEDEIIDECNISIFA
jgi:hypothetical protein